MRSNVNPFEPWRPTETAVPPPIHAARPWRPSPPPPARRTAEEPLLVEPVSPSSRKRPPKRPARPEQPQTQSSQWRAPISQWAVFIVLVVLAFLSLDSMGWCRRTHWPRFSTLGASAALFVSMAFPHPRRSWYSRLRGMAIALALAGISLWFVPTMRGVNLWSAYRQVEALRTLPAGNVAVYQRGAAARRILVQEFPSFGPDFRAAEQAWLRRTVDEAIETADRQLESDPHTALADLHRLNTELASLEHYPSVQKELESARMRAVQACAKVVRRELEIPEPRP